MRVLMVTLKLPSAGEAGTWAPVSRQIDSLRARGVDVDVVQVAGQAKLKYPEAWPKVLRRSASADLVHAHYGYCAWIGRLQWRRPLVVSFMGSDLLGTSDANGRRTLLSQPVVTIDRLLARAVDGVIVKSEEMARAVAPVRADVIPNGVDLEAFRPLDRATARAELEWPQDERRVLFAGSPGNPRKAFPLAAEAVAHASSRTGMDIRLVPLTGVAPAQVPVYMSASDALILTSHWEGSPNVVKEAMGCELPVVSVAVGDVPELLGGLERSAVCERDPAALGDALARILGDPGPSGGRLVLKQRGLDTDTVASRVLDVYQRVLSARAGAVPVRGSRYTSRPPGAR